MDLTGYTEALELTEWARDRGLLVPVENNPEDYTINPEWTKAIGALEDRVFDVVFNGAEDLTDIVRGLAMVGLIQWDPWGRGVDRDEIEKATSVFLAFYLGLKNDRLAEFTARTRLRGLK